MRTPSLDDLARFTRLELECKDLDPGYNVLRQLNRDLPEEQALWLSILYVGFYNLCSAQWAFDTTPQPDMLPPETLKLPKGTDRRGHRDVRQFTKHLKSWLEHTPFKSFLQRGFDAAGPTPESNWTLLQSNIRQVYGKRTLGGLQVG